jgi:hypothetical protein
LNLQQTAAFRREFFSSNSAASNHRSKSSPPVAHRIIFTAVWDRALDTLICRVECAMGWLATRRDAGTYPPRELETLIQQTSPVASDRLWVVVDHRHH